MAEPPRLRPWDVISINTTNSPEIRAQKESCSFENYIEGSSRLRLRVMVGLCSHELGGVLSSLGARRPQAHGRGRVGGAGKHRRAPAGKGGECPPPSEAAGGGLDRSCPCRHPGNTLLEVPVPAVAPGCGCWQVVPGGGPPWLSLEWTQENTPPTSIPISSISSPTARTWRLACRCPAPVGASVVGRPQALGSGCGRMELPSRASASALPASRSPRPCRALIR